MYSPRWCSVNMLNKFSGQNQVALAISLQLYNGYHVCRFFNVYTDIQSSCCVSLLKEWSLWFSVSFMNIENQWYMLSIFFEKVGACNCLERWVGGREWSIANPWLLTIEFQ